MKAKITNLGGFSVVSHFDNEELDATLPQRIGTIGKACPVSPADPELWLVLFDDGEIGNFMQDELELIDDGIDYSDEFNT